MTPAANPGGVEPVILLLTATVDPPAIVHLRRTDPEQRESDYINALIRWTKTTTCPMVFCENSGWDCGRISDALRFVRPGRVDFLSCDVQATPLTRGKGYGELQIIRQALERCEQLRCSRTILKVTGRYFVRNGREIIEALARPDDVMVHADLRDNGAWAESRLFAFGPSFVTAYLSSFQGSIDDSRGRYLEHALARAVHRAMADGHRWAPLPRRPVFHGTSGTFNTPLRESPFRRVVATAAHRLKNHLNRRP